MKLFKKLISLLCVFSLVFTSAIAATAEETETDYTADYELIIDRWEETIIGTESEIDLTDEVIAEKVAAYTANAITYWESMSRPTEEEAAAGMTLHEKWLSNTDRWSPSGEYNGVYPIEHKGYIWSDESANATKLVARTHFYAVRESLQRLRTMAIAYRISEDATIKGNAELKADIYTALEFICTYWYCPDAVQYGNWWQWQIGIPQSLRDLLVLLYDDLTAEREDLLDLCLTTIDTFPPLAGHTMDGANLADRSAIQIVYGALWQRDDIIQKGSNGIASVLTYVTKASGFYEADGSFIQHMYYAYTGAYGSSVMNSIAPSIIAICDTPWDISEEKKNTLVDIIQNAYEPVFYNGTVMQMTCGRCITSNSITSGVGSTYGYSSARIITNSIVMISNVIDNDKISEIKSFAKAMLQYLTSEEALKLYDYYANTDLGIYLYAKAILEDESIVARESYNMTNVFFNMDRVVQHNDTYSLGLSMSSTRISSFEGGNGNNRKGWYTGSGMLYVYNNDYTKFSDHFWYTIDSRRLPGTTVLRGVADLPYQDEGIALGQSAWAGGTSIGNYSVAGMILQPYEQTLSAKKSYFMFDNEVVALGTDITAEDGTTIESTVENIKILDDNSNTFVIDGTVQDNTLATDGVATTTTINKWAYLSGNNESSSMGYYFPESANLNIIREARTGKKRDVDTSTSVEADYVEYTKNYLTMYYDHGQYGSGDNSYSYVLLPSATEEETKAYSENSDIVVLANNENVQAVTDTTLGITGVNFFNYKSATVQKDGEDYITCNAPASVMVEETDTTITVSVSDPTQLNKNDFYIEVNASAGSVLEAHEDIEVVQYSDTVILKVDPTSKTAYEGETKTIVLEKGTNPDTTENAPEITSNTNFVIRENADVVESLEFSGSRPLTFTVENAPEGVEVDRFGTLYIDGDLAVGNYEFDITLSNAYGSDTKTFSLIKRNSTVIAEFNFDDGVSDSYTRNFVNSAALTVEGDCYSGTNALDVTSTVSGEAVDTSASTVKAPSAAVNTSSGMSATNFTDSAEIEIAVMLEQTPETAGRDQTVLVKRAEDDGVIPYAVKITSEGKIGFIWNGVLYTSDTLEWNTDEWYKIYINFDGNKIVFQRDGEACGYAICTESTVSASTVLSIGTGNTTSSDYFFGKIDEVVLAVPNAEETVSFTSVDSAVFIPNNIESFSTALSDTKNTYTYALAQYAEEELPTGISIDENGVLSYSADVVAGKYTFYLTATAEGNTMPDAVQKFTLTVTQAVDAVSPTNSFVYYSFNEGSGTAVGTESTHVQISNKYSAYDFGATISDSAEWVEGFVGSAVNFDSLSDTLKMNSSSSNAYDYAIRMSPRLVGTTEYDFWVKFNEDPVESQREQIIIARVNNNPTILWGIKVNADGQIVFVTQNAENKSTALDWNVGEWYHITITQDKNNLVTFTRDGISAGTAEDSKEPQSNKVGLYINNTNDTNAQNIITSSNYFNGTIDELCLGTKGVGESVRLRSKVTFNTGDGEAIDPQYIYLNDVAEEPETPSMDGYVFSGWYTDSEYTTAYDFASPVTTDITLYAKWIYVGRVETKTPTKSFIYYNFNEGNGTAVSTQSTHSYISSKYSAYDFGATISSSTEWVQGFVGTGLNFDSLNDTLKLNSSSSNAYDYAIRMSPRLVGTTEYDFWVKFNEDPVESGREQTIVVRSNYSKVILWGVKVNANGQIVLVTQGQENASTALSWNVGEWYHITITQDKNYLVTFKRDGISAGTAEGTEPNSSKVGLYINNTTDTNAKNIITTDNYFNGVIDELCLGTEGVGESVRVRSKITFDTAGAGYIEPQYPFYDETATAPETPIRVGYTFAGWYTDAEFTTEYDFSQTVTGDITLYAKWDSNNILFGDGNGDGEVTTEDMTILRQYLLGTLEIEIPDLDVLDVNADGYIDIKDLVRFKKYFAQIITYLGPENY